MSYFVVADNSTSLGSISLSGTTTNLISYSSPVGTESSLKLTKEKGDINPALYFRYVKSKLTKLEKDKLASRLNKLKKMLLAAEELKQQALYDTLAQMIAITVRESEALACGIDRSVARQSVEKFIKLIKDKVVRFTTFDKFPRIPPAYIRKKIKSIQSKNLFDDYWIVYVDYTKEEISSNKDKIKTKDPILFGSYAYQPDRLYFICDWIDEICDLTIDKMVDTLKLEDPTYELSKTPDMDEKYVKNLLDLVMRQHNRLKDTNTNTWRVKEKEEETDKVKTRKWWKRLLWWKK